MRKLLACLCLVALCGCGDMRRLNLFKNDTTKPSNPEAPTIDQQLILCKYGPPPADTPCEWSAIPTPEDGKP